MGWCKPLVGAMAACSLAAGFLVGTVTYVEPYSGPSPSARSAQIEVEVRQARAFAREHLPVTRIDANVQNGDVVAPSEVLEVTATDGALLGAKVLGGPTPIKGTMQDGVWTSVTPLSPGVAYQLEAHAFGPRGRHVSTVSFASQDSRDKVSIGVTPSNGSRVGVAQSIDLFFNMSVEAKDEVTQRLEVSSVPAQTGAWKWISDRQVRWRPKEFWKAGSEVKLVADLRGFEIAPGVYAVNPFTTRFSVGDEQIVRVDARKKVAEVFRNGKLVYSAPVSLGMPGFLTRDGIKVVMERYRVKRMISNLPGAVYDVESPYALRLTNSGEFMHAAPWNTANIGYRHTSHGCTNFTMSDAKWMYENLLRGDPVIFTGTGLDTMTIDNGFGEWNVSWREWKS